MGKLTSKQKKKYYKYKLLRHITFGKTKERYERKYKELRQIKKSVSQPIINYVPDNLGELQTVLSSKNYKGIIVFGTCDLGWFDTFKQRHHHIAEYFMNKGYLVLCAISFAHKLDYTDIIKRVAKNLFLVNFYDRQIWKQIINLISLYGTTAKYYSLLGTDPKTTLLEIDYLQKFGFELIYSYCDELSKEIYPALSDFQLERHERLLKDKNVIIVATADNLFEKAKSYRSENVILSKNSVSLEDFVIEEPFTPEEMKPILAEKKKIVGFYGSFAPWINYDMIKKLALERPQYNIVMIGYDYEWGKGAFAQSHIADLPNVHIINQQPYKRLKYFSQFFDIAMIPFKLTEVTKSVSPVKLFEFFGQGIPVITSKMDECLKYKACLIAENEDDFVKQADKAFELKTDVDYLRLLKETAEQNTWKSRGDVILEELNKINKAKSDNLIKPLLSIGIPMYNMESFITRCLQKISVKSILDKLEIIVVDDGSTDRSAELVNLYNTILDNKIILIQKENGGHGSCINTAVKRATGKYFKLVDSDDYLDPIALVQHINHLMSTDVDAIVTNYNRFYDSGMIEPVRFDDKLEEQIYRLEDFIKVIMKGTKFTSYAHMHSLTFKTALLKDIKITEHSFYVDNEYISYPLTNVKTISFQNIYLYQYYLGRPGQSVNPETAKKRSEQNYQIIQNIINFSEKIKNPTLTEYILNICFHASIFYVMYADSKDKKDHLLQFWKEISQENYDYLKNMQ